MPCIPRVFYHSLITSITTEHTKLYRITVLQYVMMLCDNKACALLKVAHIEGVGKKQQHSSTSIKCKT